ncbi:hypothetical protein [Methylocella sp. CPCC 101449]|uniref:hypothetical protein n=1 Tax=Methylocella sp. CPCC 101449 TaxID=2987531 RepID=UPI002891DC58|nr:hypothetical protein [Methylocella sp. CPCC 101449]MDT2022811.1 hypothetical protein [Methylocella sp. CPCC 101449]
MRGRHDATGRSTGKPADKRDRKLNSPPKGSKWTWFTVEMMVSPAWRELSINGHRVLQRICIEHAEHGGKANGTLPVTYRDFIEHGVTGKHLHHAIVEVEALGFAVRVSRGHRAYGAESGVPSLYRLTFVGVSTETDRWPATNDWRRIKDASAAKQAVRQAQQIADEQAREDRARRNPPTPAKSPMGLQEALS